MNQAPRQQLFYLLSRLRNCVEDNNEFGIILTCAVLEALLELKVRSHTGEEQHAEEMRAVYAGLERIIDTVIDRQAETVLREYRNRLGPGSRATSGGEAQSRLLRALAPLLEKRQRDEAWRKFGLHLAADVFARGPLLSRRDVIHRDHHALEAAVPTKSRLGE